MYPAEGEWYSCEKASHLVDELDEITGITKLIMQVVYGEFMRNERRVVCKKPVHICCHKHGIHKIFDGKIKESKSGFDSTC